MVSSFFFFFSSPNLSGRRLDVYHTSSHGGVNLECRSETCCAGLAGHAGPKKSPKSRYLGTIPQLCRAISAHLRHVSTIGKNLLSNDMSSTCPHNMVNFSLLTAEICLASLGHPCIFQRVSRLGSVTAPHLVVGVSQTLRR